MLADVTLDEVKKLMGREGASWSKILEALDYYGISYSPKSVYPKEKEYELPKCCIVYDGVGFNLYYNGSYQGTNKNFINVASYREILI